MAVSFLTPARTVLLVGDEALYIYKVSHNNVKMVDSVPWQTEDFDDMVIGMIRKDCGGKPVLILNDMTDQHFKGGQRMPKVGMADKSSVLKRKLQVAFPNYPIRGALPVKAGKNAPGADGVKNAGGLYLFAAVPVSEQIVKTLEAVKLSMAPIAGFALLPVESSDMVRAISEKLAGGSKKASRWSVFMGQHQNGALRQVITRDGQLAMTRMTPVGDADNDPGTWAQEVSQEFKATISYLSRFGYSAEEGTDVIVIANQEAGGALEQLIDQNCNFHSFTAPEAARLLGMKIGIQDEVRYADPLHAAWAGRKSKFILPMQATDIEKIDKPRKAVAAAMFLLFLSAGYLAWQLMDTAQQMVSTRSDLTEQRTVLAQAEAEYDREVKRMEALGFDIKLIQGSIATYEDFEGERLRLFPLFKGIGEALGNELRLDTLRLEQLAGVQGRASSIGGQEQKPEKAKLEARLGLSFPPTIELEYGIKEVRDLHRRLINALPDYDIEVTRQVARPEYTQNIKGEAGRTAQEIAADEDYVAELVVRGPKK